MVTALMISAKLTTRSFLKIKKFQNKAYDIKIFDYDVTNKILSLESNYIVDCMFLHVTYAF